MLAKQREISLGVGSFDTFSPPPSDDESDDEVRITSNDENTGNAISIDDFMDMNKDIFGDIDTKSTIISKADDCIINPESRHITTSSFGEILTGTPSQSGIKVYAAPKSVPIAVNNKPTLTVLTKEQLKKLQSTGVLRAVKRPPNLPNSIIHRIETTIPTDKKPCEKIHMEKVQSMPSPPIDIKPSIVKPYNEQSNVVTVKNEYIEPVKVECPEVQSPIKNIPITPPTIPPQTPPKMNPVVMIERSDLNQQIQCLKQKAAQSNGDAEDRVPTIPHSSETDKDDSLNDNIGSNISGCRRGYKTSKGPIPCDVCSKKFDTTSGAIYHKHVYHPDAPKSNFCSWCGKRFPIKHLLDIHIETHPKTKVKPMIINCEDCEAVFYCEKALKSHHDLYHKKHVEEQNKTIMPSKKLYLGSTGKVLPVYNCQFCGCEFHIKYSLQRHLNDLHADKLSEEPQDLFITCDLCDASFENSKAYEMHLNFHTSKDFIVNDDAERKRLVTITDQDFDASRVRKRTLRSGKYNLSPIPVTNATPQQISALKSEPVKKTKLSQSTRNAPSMPKKSKLTIAKRKRGVKK